MGIIDEMLSVTDGICMKFIDISDSKYRSICMKFGHYVQLGAFVTFQQEFLSFGKSEKSYWGKKRA